MCLQEPESLHLPATAHMTMKARVLHVPIILFGGPAPTPAPPPPPPGASIANTIISGRGPGPPPGRPSVPIATGWLCDWVQIFTFGL